MIINTQIRLHSCSKLFRVKLRDANGEGSGNGYGAGDGYGYAFGSGDGW